MKNKIKYSIIFIVTFIIFTLLNINSVDAASASISGNQTVAPGTKVTITASVNAGAWDLTLSGGGKSQRLFGNTTSIGNASDSKSITFVANQTTKVTLTGTIKDFNASDESTPETVSKSITVTVNQSASSTSSTANNANTTNAKTNTNQETQKKSNNANLSNLGIRPNDFSGFKAGTTTYNVTVPKNVEEVEVYAKAQDSKAKVAGTGKKKLQEGKNTTSVTVTAEDGTKKTYTINITRSATEENNQDEETDDPEADDNNETDVVAGKGLSELKIGNLELSPTFRTDIYEYTAKYIGEDTKLEVSTITTEDDYTIEVTGNEDLKEGENIITILVSDAEGNNVATYQVTVNKSLAQETLLENQDENGMKILGIVVGVVIVLIIIFLIVRHRRNKKWEEEYSTPFSTLNDNDDNIYKNQLEDFDENMKPTKRKENRDSHQDKKAAKEEYLNNFNSNNDEYPEWQEEKVRKRRTKGKRFK